MWLVLLVVGALNVLTGLGNAHRRGRRASQLIHRTTCIPVSGNTHNQTKRLTSHAFPTDTSLDRTTTTTASTARMPSVFSNPAWQPLLIQYRGMTPSDEDLRQTPHYSLWDRVYWQLVWAQGHARELHNALLRQQAWPLPPKCLTRDAAESFTPSPHE
jgi:hypothetical protein